MGTGRWEKKRRGGNGVKRGRWLHACVGVGDRDGRREGGASGGGVGGGVLSVDVRLESTCRVRKQAFDER